MTPKTNPTMPPMVAPILPIEAIREAVRAEMAVMHNAAIETASKAAAAAVAQARISSVTALFSMVAYVLSVRLSLFLVLGGGFALAVMAMQRQTYESAAVLVAYAVLLCIPVVWLETKKGSPPS